MNVLVFDLETIPDIEGGQAIYDLEGLDDKSTAKAMFHLQKQKTGNDFLSLHLQKIVAISIAARNYNNQSLSVESLGDTSANEAELLELFFSKIDEQKPDLVSWNGVSFDLTVLQYRSLKNVISLPKYWEEGNYHHNDLKFLLSGYNFDNSAHLDDIAKLLGFPGKLGMDGSQVWKEYLNGNLQGIRNYCETDVLNTYLIYLRYTFMRGDVNAEVLAKENQLLRDFLDNSGQNHLLEFSKCWARN